MWVRFEREYGSLEDFDLAVQKVLFSATANFNCPYANVKFML